MPYIVVCTVLLSHLPWAVAENWKLTPARPFPADYLGVNGNLAGTDQPWEDEALCKALQELNVTTLRYPGGTVGNFWDWSKGGIDAALSRDDFGKVPWVGALQRRGGTYTLENLRLAAESTGVVPVFVLNMTK